MDLKGIIFDIQRFSVHDGPGIRTVVFMKGCPLRCQWCHNPESQGLSPDLFFEEALCVSCGRCAAVCPEGVHTIVNGRRSIGRRSCKRCGRCVDACLSGALVFKGRTATVNDIVAEVLRDRAYYSKSGGGVTLSGGEPLAQPAFAKRLLVESKRHGLHTAIETSGHVRWEVFEDVLDFVDFVMFDIKIADLSLHNAYCGVDNTLIHRNLRRVVDMGEALLVRIPLIPGISDTDDNLKQIAKLLTEVGIDRVELVPYHAFSKDKCDALGREYLLAHISPHSDEQLQEIVRVMSSCGISTHPGSTTERQRL